MSFFANAKDTKFYSPVQLNAGNARGHISTSSTPALLAPATPRREDLTAASAPSLTIPAQQTHPAPQWSPPPTHPSSAPAGQWAPPQAQWSYPLPAHQGYPPAHQGYSPAHQGPPPAQPGYYVVQPSQSPAQPNPQTQLSYPSVQPSYFPQPSLPVAQPGTYPTQPYTHPIQTSPHPAQPYDPPPAQPSPHSVQSCPPPTQSNPPPVQPNPPASPPAGASATSESPPTSHADDGAGQFFSGASGTSFFGPVQMNTDNTQGYIYDSGSPPVVEVAPPSPSSPISPEPFSAQSPVVAHQPGQQPPDPTPLLDESSTLDEFISGADTLVRLAKGAGGLAGIPALGQAADIALVILKAVKATKANKDDFHEIGKQCLFFVITVKERVEHSSTGADKSLRADAASLLKNLRVVRKEVDKFNKRSWLRRFLFSSVDEDLVKKCRDQLANALSQFHFLTDIQLRKDMQELLRMVNEAQKGSGSRQTQARRRLQRAEQRVEAAARERERAAQELERSTQSAWRGAAGH